MCTIPSVLNNCHSDISFKILSASETCLSFHRSKLVAMVAPYLTCYLSIKIRHSIVFKADNPWNVGLSQFYLSKYLKPYKKRSYRQHISEFRISTSFIQIHILTLLERPIFQFQVRRFQLISCYLVLFISLPHSTLIFQIFCHVKIFVIQLTLKNLVHHSCLKNIIFVYSTAALQKMI